MKTVCDACCSAVLPLSVRLLHQTISLTSPHISFCSALNDYFALRGTRSVSTPHCSDRRTTEHTSTGLADQHVLVSYLCRCAVVCSEFTVPRRASGRFRKPFDFDLDESVWLGYGALAQLNNKKMTQSNSTEYINPSRINQNCCNPRTWPLHNAKSDDGAALDFCAEASSASQLHVQSGSLLNSKQHCRAVNVDLMINE
jgi:hypothetical protein